jgi:hypothetical protein
VAGGRGPSQQTAQVRAHVRTQACHPHRKTEGYAYVSIYAPLLLDVFGKALHGLLRDDRLLLCLLEQLVDELLQVLGKQLAEALY